MFMYVCVYVWAVQKYELKDYRTYEGTKLKIIHNTSLLFHSSKPRSAVTPVGGGLNSGGIISPLNLLCLFKT